MNVIRDTVRKLRSISRYYRLLWNLKISRGDVKLIIGAARTGGQGWFSTDHTFLDLTKEADWARLFTPSSISSVLAEHVWEHLTENDAITAGNICYKYIKKGGVLRIAVPDGFHPKLSYIEQVKPGGIGPGADDHKVLYTYKSLCLLLNEVGFETKLLEYFDENGQFHEVDWNADNGMVLRSKKHDKRNDKGEINYSSIIIDATKLN
ncbi:hypothetical protein [Methylophaga sp.]|uniref:class I SAM-dependent methyltransferase n=1 Tax=Methylophaga sp. TaxID=2024840 RepID=UPI0025CF2390|nr:hypothetical protein [Methylophaga sp.]